MTKLEKAKNAVRLALIDRFGDFGSLGAMIEDVVNDAADSAGDHDPAYSVIDREKSVEGVAYGAWLASLGSYFDEVASYGCDSGAAPAVSDRHDTMEFYKKYHVQIGYLIYLENQDGAEVRPENWDGWDKADPLAFTDNNKERLVWWAYETICWAGSDVVQELMEEEEPENEKDD